MTNKTQCPNCLTVYFITDEQYQRSKGRVRCGTCRQPFSASFLADNESIYNTASEPSDPPSNSKEAERSAYEAARDDLAQNTLPASSIPPSQAKEISRLISKGDEQLDSWGSSESNEEEERSISDNEPDAPDLAKQVDNLVGEKIFHESQELPPAADGIEYTDKETIENEESEPQQATASVSNAENKSFSEEVSDTGDSEPLLLDEPFYLDGKRPRGKLYRWLGRPILALIIFLIFAVLLIALGYQLWLRQALPILENEALADKVVPYIEPLKSELDERLGFQLPVRRDLANLRLVSARIEPHPTRSSTTLLKVTILNRSAIAQPFPSMELALTDEGGRLVSRRSLSPEDYLHNNRLQNKVRPNELRQITVELLTFPKQAHGYELKLLSK